MIPFPSPEDPGERLVVPLKVAIEIMMPPPQRDGTGSGKRKYREGYFKKYYLENRDRILARQREYDAAHREAKKQKRREYYPSVKAERVASVGEASA